MIRRLMALPYGFVVFCLLLYVASEAIERAVLIGVATAADPTAFADLIRAIPAGALADTAMAVLIGLPFLMLSHHLGHRQRGTTSRVVAELGLLALVLAIGFENVSDVLFWNEFDSRFNGIAVNYLLFPREVIGNLRESFDFRIIGPALVVISAILYMVVRAAYSVSRSTTRPVVSHRHFYAATTATACVAALIVAAMPLDVSANRETNELATNGIWSLARAALTNDAAYDGVYPGMDDREAVALARAQVAQDNTQFLTPDGTRSLLRHVDNGDRPRRLNIVIALEESFGSTFVDNLDNNRAEAISPNLVRLARDGLWFTNMHSTGLRTVRGLEATLTSFPPIPGVATTRRPGSRGMNSLPFVLRDLGYETAFLYGGLLPFDNMETFLGGIGFQHLWGQTDIAEIGFKTIWGAADEYIFGEALRRMDALHAAGKPAFLNILTVSNHRPYTFPDGRIGKDPNAKRIENCATYADWAFGNFIERARSHPWFADTVFVFIADHGPRISGAAQVPVERYRIPLLVYSPGNIAPGVIDTVGSSMDLAPTLLGLLGFSYDSPFFGVDLRRVPAGKGRALMDHSFSVALARDGHLVTLEPGRRSLGYAFKAEPHPLRQTEAPDAETQRRAIALFQTAHRMFYAGEYHRNSKAIARAEPR